MKYIALVPAYEPGPVLLDVVKDLKQCGMKVIVVNDGSQDKFKERFEEVSEYAKVIGYEQNQGKGVALKTGLRYIKEHYDADCVIVTVDADGQHLSEDAFRICRTAEKKQGTLILGSRKRDRKVPLRSRLGNGMTQFVYRLTTGLKVYDTQTGLRAFHGSMIPKLLSVSGQRYEYEMNILLEFAREKIPIYEEEISTIYLDNNESSHFDTIKDSIRIYKEILKFSASSFISFLVDYVFYGLFLLVTGDLKASNIGARMLSASVNYTLNRMFVFEEEESSFKSIFEYAVLAALILIGNTWVLEMLVYHFGINQMVAKIVTELTFFILSWTIQKFAIFSKKESKEVHKG